MLATREGRFWVWFVASFVVFGTLMNLLNGGFSKFQLMWAVGLPGALRILTDAVFAILGVGRPITEWLPTLALATLQGALIGLIGLLAHKKRLQKSKIRPSSGPNGRMSTSKTRPRPSVRMPRAAGANSRAAALRNASTLNEGILDTSDDIQRAGIITGLVALGAGCPTCGTTLITPLLGTFLSTGSLAVAGVISSVVTVLAVAIALLSLRRIGLETYVIIVNERYLQKRIQKSRAKVEKTEKGVGANGAKSAKNDKNR